MILVLTATYNKGELTMDALDSVYRQTYENWELVILENSNDDITRSLVLDWHFHKATDSRIVTLIENYTKERREESYVVADFINEQWKEALSRPEITHLFWISDDDVIDTTTFEKMIDMDKDVVYCKEDIYEYANGIEKHIGSHLADRELGKGTALVPDCNIDGGSILFKKDCLLHLAFPYYPNSADPDIAHHCDGLFMNKLAEYFTFHPLDEGLLKHRITKFSTWNKLNEK